MAQSRLEKIGTIFTRYLPSYEISVQALNTRLLQSSGPPTRWSYENRG